MTAQEINEAIARKLHGDDNCHWPGHISNSCHGQAGQCTWPPNYCHDIKAAWEIVEFWQREGFVFDLRYEPENKMWTIFLMKVVISKNIEMAICLAFLKLP